MKKHVHRDPKTVAKLILLIVWAATLLSTTLTPAAFPGENDKIAFDGQRRGNGEVLVMNADGSDPTQTTTILTTATWTTTVTATSTASLTTVVDTTETVTASMTSISSTGSGCPPTAAAGGQMLMQANDATVTLTSTVGTASLTSTTFAQTTSITSATVTWTRTTTTSATVSTIGWYLVCPATGSGTVTFYTEQGSIVELTAVSEGSLPTAGKPSGVNFPHGFFRFRITGIQSGATAVVTIVFPTPIPVGTQYWKVHDGAWTQLPPGQVGDNDGDQVLTLTLTDDATPDDDDGLPNGEIVDDGGPGVPPAVGGQILTIDRYQIALPWLVLASVLTLAVVPTLVLRPRRAR